MDQLEKLEQDIIEMHEHLAKVNEFLNKLYKELKEMKNESLDR